MLRQPQHGQALVGVLVVMMLVFLLAGAVSIGAINVLGRTDSTHDPTADDLAVQNAVAIAANHAASRGPCGARQAPDFTFGKNVGFCASVADMPSPRLSTLALTEGAPSGCSGYADLKSATSVRWVIILTAHWQPGSYAYIGDGGAAACPPSLPTKLPQGCFAEQLPDAYAVAYPIALKCAPTGARPALYVRNGSGQIRSALSMQLDSSSSGTGVMYVTVTSTGLVPPKDYEQAVLYSPRPNAVNLKLEAALL